MTVKKDHLKELPPWTVDKAHQIAAGEGLIINDDHLQILFLAREFFRDYGFSPSMRPLCKVVTASLGTEKGRSIYLNKLFFGSPAKRVATLAGLPKPKTVFRDYYETC